MDDSQRNEETEHVQDNAQSTLTKEDTTSQTPEEMPEKQQLHQKNLQHFLQRFQSLNEAEEKLRLAIDFMRRSLSSDQTPYFKGFWEARQLCVPLFKEPLATAVRSQLWNEYRQLCSESQRLKHVLEEQSAFAVEQIELAIQSQEKEMQEFEARLSTVPEIDFGPIPEALAPHMAQYALRQKELFLLNTYATRINALRRELIKTEMRIRQKNKFFKRLSQLGDEIFPKRKELIKHISHEFLESVENFCRTHFSSHKLDKPLFYYREEIKNLQGIAKILTLNTQAFTQTRSQLSECWDQVKELEKQRKKLRTEQRSAYQHNIAQFSQQMEELGQEFSAGALSVQAAGEKIDDIINQMQQTPLGREEKRMLREKLAEVRAPIISLIEQEKKVQTEKEQKAENEKKERIRNIRDKVQNLIDESASLTAEEILARKEAILQEIQSTPLHKIEKQNLERSLKPLKDIVAEQKEKALLSLSEQDVETLHQLQTILEERKERRKEVKAALEEVRKAAGSSGLNFEQAMSYQQQAQEEKKRLEKINHSIEEIESKIQEIEG